MQPTYIHQIWLQGEEQLPEIYKEAVVKTKELNPDYIHVIWTDESLRELVKTHLPWFLKTYDGYPFWIQRVDAGKYVALWVYGGFYMDMDLVSVGPLDKIVRDSFSDEVDADGMREAIPALVKHSKSITALGNVTINNNFLYSPRPQHPFYDLLIKSLTPASERFVYEMKLYYICKSTGPIFLMDTVDKYERDEGRFLLPFSEKGIHHISDDEVKGYFRDRADKSWMKNGWIDNHDRLFYLFIVFLIVLIVIALVKAQ